MPPIKDVLSVDGVKRRVQSRCYEVFNSSNTGDQKFTTIETSQSHRIMNIEIYRLINLPKDGNKFYLFKMRMSVSIYLLVMEDNSA